MPYAQYDFLDVVGQGFAGEKFMYYDFSDINFDEKDLTNCQFYGCTLENSTFLRLDFSGSKFIGCVLNGCDFLGSKMEGVRFSDCSMDNTCFQHCNLTEASFATSLKFHNTDFRGAILTHTDLRNMNIGEMILSSATQLDNAILK